MKVFQIKIYVYILHSNNKLTICISEWGNCMKIYFFKTFLFMQINRFFAAAAAGSKYKNT